MWAELTVYKFNVQNLRDLKFHLPTCVILCRTEEIAEQVQHDSAATA